MGGRDVKPYGKAMPVFLTWLRSSDSKRLPIRKTDETYATTFLWAKRSASRPHGRVRTQGTGELYQRFAQSLSRRQLGALAQDCHAVQPDNQPDLNVCQK
jgi:hypothetical protein